MIKLLRKTITIPEKIYRQAKIHAGYCNENFSAYVVNILEEKIYNKKKNKKLKDPFKSMGTLSVGINKKWKRNEIYEDYLRRKMGI